MSLVDADHIQPARNRPGVYYKLMPVGGDKMAGMKPGMIFWYDIKGTDKMCPNCFRTPFSNETKVCPRCGGKIE